MAKQVHKAGSGKRRAPDEWIIEQFMRELLFQSELVVLGWSDLREALGKGEEVRIWYHIHAILTAVARISNLLWPSHSHLAKPLRRALKLGKGPNPLRPKRFRDIFEHFAERLENWAAVEAECFADRNIDFGGKPIARITQVQGRDVRELRRYEARTSTVWFQGERLELEPIIAAVEDLRGNLSACGCKFQ